MPALRPKETRTGIVIDYIDEKTADNGVTLESVSFKDGLVDGIDVSKQMVFSTTETHLGGSLYRKCWRGSVSMMPVYISFPSTEFDQILRVGATVTYDDGSIAPLSSSAYMPWSGDTFALSFSGLPSSADKYFVFVEYSKA